MKKIGGILFTLLFVAIGVYLLWSGAKMKRVCTEVTEGIVVNVEREVSRDTSSDSYKSTYYPVVKYSAGGREITKRSSNGSSRSQYSSNERITIHYDPNNVEIFIIDGDNTILFVGIVFILIGSIATIGQAVGIFKN